MRFTFTDDQRVFQRTVSEFLEKECTPERLRTGELRLFDRLREMGVTEMLAPEDAGGMGLDFTDLVLVLEEAGRFALPDPLVEHAAVAVPLLPHDHPPLVTVAAPFAPDADRADVVLILRGDDVVAVTDPVLTPLRSLDPTRRLFDVAGDGPVVAEAARARELGALGTAAMCIGVAERLIDMASTYAREREQFGKPIGEFQLLKGLLADAAVRLTFARPVVYNAAHSVARDLPTRGRDVSMGKALASEAVSEAARAALQVHGAIGYTEEHDLHLWLKRAWVLANAWGTAAAHREHIARAVL